MKIIGIDSAALREHGWLFDIAGEDTRFVVRALSSHLTGQLLDLLDGALACQTKLC